MWVWYQNETAAANSIWDYVFGSRLTARNPCIWSLIIHATNGALFLSYLIETVTFFACPSHAMTTVPSGALNSAV